MAEIAQKPVEDRNKDLKYEAENIFKNFPKDINGNISISKVGVLNTPELGQEFLDWIGYKEATMGETGGWFSKEIETSPESMPKINSADIWKFLKENTDKMAPKSGSYNSGETSNINGIDYVRNEQGQWVGK